MLIIFENAYLKSLSENDNLLSCLLNEMRSAKVIFNRNESIIVALHPLSFPTHLHTVLHSFVREVLRG